LLAAEAFCGVPGEDSRQVGNGAAQPVYQAGGGSGGSRRRQIQRKQAQDRLAGQVGKKLTRLSDHRPRCSRNRSIHLLNDIMRQRWSVATQPRVFNSPWARDGPDRGRTPAGQ